MAGADRPHAERRRRVLRRFTGRLWWSVSRCVDHAPQTPGNLLRQPRKSSPLRRGRGGGLSWDLLLLEQTAAGEPPVFGRATVSIASGMLAARLAISPVDAVAFLRAYSFHVDQSIFAVATAITNRTLDTTAITDI